MKISGSTPLYGLLGAPVSQSMSPMLQNGWIEEHGFDGVYVAFPIDPNHFEAAAQGLFHAGVQGCNVTYPFKERAADLCVQTSAQAKATHSVNCLMRGEGGFVGTSTDGAGLLADLDARASGWRQMGGHIVILGAGGAARAILHALSDNDAPPITLVNRNVKRAQEAIDILPRTDLTACGWDQVSSALDGAAVVINATSLGLNGDSPLELDLSGTQSDCLIYDSVYAPRQTAFLTSARAQNRATLDGLGMLVGQGALSFEHWFGVRPDIVSGLARLEQGLQS